MKYLFNAPHGGRFVVDADSGTVVWAEKHSNYRVGYCSSEWRFYKSVWSKGTDSPTWFRLTDEEFTNAYDADIKVEITCKKSDIAEISQRWNFRRIS